MNDSIHNHVSYAAVLPLQWEPLPAPPSPEQYREWQEQNLRVLTMASALEDRQRAAATNEPADPTQAELERLHQKLDVLLVLFGQFLRGTQPKATPHPLQLSSVGIRWLGAPPPTERVLVSLWLHSCLPEPFCWPGHQSADGQGWQELQFDPLPDALESALERHVFLHHRRSVAGMRQPGGTVWVDRS